MPSMLVHARGPKAKRERLEDCRVEASLGYAMRSIFTEAKQISRIHYYFSGPRNSAIELKISIVLSLQFTFWLGWPSMLEDSYFVSCLYQHLGICIFNVSFLPRWISWVTTQFGMSCKIICCLFHLKIPITSASLSLGFELTFFHI